MRQYRVSVWTGPTPGDGSDADVWLKFFGTSNNASRWLETDDPNYDDLEFNRVDTFYFNTDFGTELQPGTVPDIWFVPRNASPGWRCDTIKIAYTDDPSAGVWTDMGSFHIDRWFDVPTNPPNDVDNLPVQAGPPNRIQPTKSKHHHRNVFPVGGAFPDNPDI
jgi:hypothetical protein